MRGGGVLRTLAGKVREAIFGSRYGGGRADGGGGGPAARGRHVVTTGGSTGEGGRGSYQGGGSYGGGTGGHGDRRGRGRGARGGRRARGSDHDHGQEGEGSQQTNGWWRGLRRRLGKLEDRDLLEDLEDIHYHVEQIEKYQNLPERIIAIGQKFHNHWIAASIAVTTICATVSEKLQDQATSMKTKLIGVKDSVKERLSPQKVRPKDDEPEDAPAAIPLATDFSP